MIQYYRSQGLASTLQCQQQASNLKASRVPERLWSLDRWVRWLNKPTRGEIFKKSPRFASKCDSTSEKAYLGTLRTAGAGRSDTVPLNPAARLSGSGVVGWSRPVALFGQANGRIKPSNACNVLAGILQAGLCDCPGSSLKSLTPSRPGF
jgi:hypothetical protein